jgi:hypothetical protein
MLRPGLLVVIVAVAAGCGLTPPAPIAPIAGFVAAESPELLSARTGLKAYYGITHTHVAENGDDGQGTLAEAYAYGHGKGKLDFMSVSSHSHMIDDAGYQRLRAAAAAATQDGKFVAIPGQEWSSISKGGHITILDANARCELGNGDWASFYQKWLPAHPEVAFVQFNHPHPTNPLEFGGKGFNPLDNARSSQVAEDKIRGMALLNGPGKYTGEDMHGEPDDFDRGVNKLNYEVEYQDFLNRGWKIGAIGDQDNHVKTWGTAVPTRTGIWAKNLSKAGVLEALKARRTFAAFDNNVKLWFELNGAPMGSETSSSKALAVKVVATDPDTTIKRVELYGDVDGPGGQPARLLAKADVNKKTVGWAATLPAVPGESYYYAKLVYDDQHAWAWTSPIWVNGR